MRVLALVCFGVLGVTSTTAQASAFGEENLTLAAILEENIGQSLNITSTLHYMRLVAEDASDVAYFARDSVKAANNLRLILKNPKEFGSYALRSWASIYPDAQAILAHTIDMRMALQELRDPEFYKTYDPYAYVRAFDSLQNVEKGAYETAARTVDLWHVHEPHDEVLKLLEKEHQAAIGALEEIATAINTSSLSPNRARVFAAKTSAISAMANVQAAAAIEKMVGQQQLDFMRQGDTADAARTQWQRMLYDITRIEVDWRLKPGQESGR